MIADTEALPSFVAIHKGGPRDRHRHHSAGGGRDAAAGFRQTGAPVPKIQEHHGQARSQPGHVIGMVEEVDFGMGAAVGGRHGARIIGVDVENHPPGNSEQSPQVGHACAPTQASPVEIDQRHVPSHRNNPRGLERLSLPDEHDGVALFVEEIDPSFHERRVPADGVGLREDMERPALHRLHQVAGLSDWIRKRGVLLEQAFGLGQNECAGMTQPCDLGGCLDESEALFGIAGMAAQASIQDAEKSPRSRHSRFGLVHVSRTLSGVGQRSTSADPEEVQHGVDHAFLFFVSEVMEQG
ncbi:MAG: hypothetical protein WCR51_04000 [Planctomycetia bacterium]